MKKISKIWVGLVFAICIVLCNYIIIQENEKEMDLVSTINIDGQEKLVIVANCSTIEDKVEFAKKVLQKYVQNSFYTIRLSDSQEVNRLEVIVYLSREHIKKNSPVMGIEYKSKGESGCNIKENPEQFDIYIDDAI